MNLDNIERLAKWFEDGADGFQFDMNVGFVPQDTTKPTATFCGTAGCIAGAAAVMHMTDMYGDNCRLDSDLIGCPETGEIDISFVDDMAAKFLGTHLTSNLFASRCAPPRATPAEAARALREFASGNRDDPWGPVRVSRI